MPLIEDEPQKKKLSHELGQNLDALSVNDLTERLELLRDEMRRLEAARAKKSASLSAADAFFKL